MNSLRRRIDRWIVAHRGVSARYPENTRAAFAAAVACGADAIECDLQLTSDQQIVVCHDSTLERFGHAGVVVAETSLRDLQALDAGSWLAAEFFEERLMSLPELLSEFGSRIPLLLELKPYDRSPAETDSLIRGVLTEIANFTCPQQLQILCFDANVLQRIHELSDRVELIWNTCEPDQITAAQLAAQPWLSGIDCRIGELSDSVVRIIHEQNLAAFSFTCNTDEEVQQAWNLHVDGIISDDPQRTLTILRTHGRRKNDSGHQQTAAWAG